MDNQADLQRELRDVVDRGLEMLSTVCDPEHAAEVRADVARIRSGEDPGDGPQLDCGQRKAS